MLPSTAQDLSYKENWVGAFFDVDNTLIPGPSIEILFFRHLWKLGLVDFRHVWQSLRYLLNHMPPVSFGPLRAYKPYLIEQDPDFIKSLAKDFVRSTISPKLSHRATAVLSRHQEAGHHIALISGSPDFLVKPLAVELEVPVAHAARLETNEHGYTGRVLAPLPYGEGKRRVVEHLASRYRLDLNRSYAYGDSPGDLQTLETVGYPLVVNPIRGMSRIARQHGWPVTQWV